MQKLFQELWIYGGNIDGNYASIKETIISFQLENGIISSRTVDDAGYIGPKTANFLEKKYPAGIFKEQKKYPFSAIQMRKLDTTILQLEKALEKKAWGNIGKINLYKKKIVTSITKMMLSTKNKITQLKLEYLKNNI